MMVGTAFGHVIQQREILQDLRSFQGVGLHDRVFLIRQPGRLVQNIVRNSDLSDVMHPCRPFDLVAFLLVHAVLLGNCPGIQRHTVTVFTGPLVLGVHRAGDGQHGLFAHLRLPVGFSQLAFHFLFPALNQQPGHPAHREHRHRQDVENEPVVVVEFLLAIDLVGPFCHNVLFVAVVHRQPEGIIPGRQIRVDDGVQAVLRHHGPFVLEALQLVSHIGFLDREVDDLREQLQPADAPFQPDGRVPVHPFGHTIQFNLGNTHPVSHRSRAEPIRVDCKHARIASKEQVPGFVVKIAPAVGRQAAVQAAARVQQFVGNFILPAEQFAPVCDIDAGAGHDIKGIHALNPDIIVVEIGEIAQLADRLVRIHVAQAVAGHDEHAAGPGIPYGPQNDFRAQSVRPRHHFRHLAVLDDGNSVAVCSGQNPPVFQLRHRQDHGADLSFGVQDRILHGVVPDKTDACVPCCQNRAITELGHDPGPAAESAVFPVITVLIPVLVDFNQPVAVGADPQIVPVVHQHTADPLPFQQLRPFVGNLFAPGQVHHIQPLVRPDVIGPFPFHNGVDHLVVHAYRAVNIPEI